METDHRLEMRPSERRPSGALAFAARAASCLMLAGLLVGCAASSPAEPIPLPDPPTSKPGPDQPKEGGKGWKPVTG